MGHDYGIKLEVGIDFLEELSSLRFGLVRSDA